MFLGAFVEENRRDKGRYYARLQRMAALCGFWSFGVVDLDARRTHMRVDDDPRLNGNSSHFGLRKDNNFFCGDPPRQVSRSDWNFFDSRVRLCEYDLRRGWLIADLGMIIRDCISVMTKRYALAIV